MWAVLPVKSLASSKKRLGGTLSPAERYAFSGAMTGDTLAVLAACPAVHGVVIVSNDEDVAEIASLYGIEVLPEPEAGGLNASVEAAAELLVSRGKMNMMVIHNDMPLLTVESLDQVAYQHGQLLGEDGAITIVTDRVGKGSNIVIANPPQAVTFAYGEESRYRHEEQAKEKGIPCQVINNPELALDVDDEELLKIVTDALFKKQPLTITGRWLKDSGVAERLNISLPTAGPVVSEAAASELAAE